MNEAIKNYGNKYQRNRKTISIENKLFQNLENIQRQRNFKSKGELLNYLIDLDKTFNPKLETMYFCKKCYDKIDVHKDMNLDRLIHKDLCKDSKCNGSIISRYVIEEGKEDKDKQGKKEEPEIVKLMKEKAKEDLIQEKEIWF